MSMSGPRGGPKKLACCLAGAMTLAVFATFTRAGTFAPDSEESPEFLARTFDSIQQEPTTAPTTSTTEPATGPSPLLPAAAGAAAGAAAAHQAEMEQVSRGDGEIVPLNERRRGPLTYSLTLLYMGGNVIGTLQTPVANTIATTSANRPSFSELGIDHANIGDAEFGVGWGNSQIFFGAQYNHMSGSSTLGRSLVTGGVTFPAHAQLSSEVRMDWYRLGYRYTFVLDTATNGVPDLTLAPMVDVLYWDYNYSVDGGRIGQVGKSLRRWGFQLGGTFAWRPYGGRLSVEANLAGFPQNERLATIAQESVLLRYRFYEYRQYDFNVLLGVAWQQEYYNDKKVGAPNKIEADFGTMILTGLQMNF
jgi:hypothetical protein